MSEKERMLAGRLYLPFDEELGRDNKKARMLTRLFNSSTEEQQDYRNTGKKLSRNRKNKALPPRSCRQSAFHMRIR
jgi:hypothetical protein